MPLPSDEKPIALSQDLLKQFDVMFGLHPGFRLMRRVSCSPEHLYLRPNGVLYPASGKLSAFRFAARLLGGRPTVGLQTLDLPRDACHIRMTCFDYSPIGVFQCCYLPSYTY